jgi:hypothetical protein
LTELESLLAQFAKETGLSHLVPDTSGGCTLLFDDLTVVNIQPNEPGERVILSATVCDYRLDNELMVLRELAAANLNAVGTGGAVLAANTRDRHILLQHHEPLAGLEWQRLANLISRLLDGAEFWRKRLDALSDGQNLPEAHIPFSAQRA